MDIRKKIAKYPERLSEAQRIYNGIPSPSELLRAVAHSPDLATQFFEFDSKLRLYELNLKRAKTAYEDILSSISTDLNHLNAILNQFSPEDSSKKAQSMRDSMRLCKIQLSEAERISKIALGKIEPQLETVKTCRKALEIATEASDLTALASLKLKLLSAFSRE